MNGVITDKSGAGLPGATVIAVHTPTNTQYVAPTNSEGRFNIQGMRVGGPYTVRVTFIGYADAIRENITLSLGQNQRLDINLSEATQQLNEVVVSGARDRVINSSRTGAETTVSREQIQRLPTLSRSLNDFTRLTPQANGGGSSSIGGSNNRYNNITIDGAVNNDVFGLAGSGTPGGQSGTTPIALDAIQEIQVVVAPYDVTLGNFTGGGVNAVTRSGTNEVQASIYGFGRNQNSVGKSVTEPRTKADEFYNYQTGARVGGALVRDKVFFFLNAEIARQSTPLSFEPGTSTSRFRTSALDSITSYVSSRYGYDVGEYGSINARRESNKIFGRLDFNLSQNHQLTVRHNYVKAFDDNISRSSTQIRFGNNAYKFNNVTNSSVAELNSVFGRFSNKLLLSYSRIRDTRGTSGGLFPTFEINDKGLRYTLGTERSSSANQLDQDIVEVTDNVTAAFGKHTITLGTHNEWFKFRNLFINNGNGYYQFNSLQNFYNGTSNRLQAAYPTADNGEAAFKAMQLGFYAQDQYSPVENLRLTLGARIDVPVFIDKPAYNADVEAQTAFAQYGKINTQNVPSGQVLFAPRVGFNWDVNNDQKIQVRGGTGIFTGRVPFVWISNSYTNSGVIQGSVDVNNPASTTNAAGQKVVLTDIGQFPTYYQNGAVKTTQINVLSDDFKLPQVWRSNLAVDFRLPGDIVATLEGIYSKTVNDIYYRDINLAAPVGRLAGADQRPVYSSVTASSNPSVAVRRIDPKFTNVYLLDNTNKGYRYNATAQLQKQFKNGLNTSVAYTYGKSKEINSGSSSTASSNFGFNQIQFDPNNPELGYSRNDQRHRVLATGGYTFHYAGDKLATGLSVVYEGLSGQPLTYLYNRDLNNDGSTGNDLIYIPRDVRDVNEIKLAASEGRTLAQVQDQLDAFINNDPYLRSHRGQYAERFAARLPWTHQIDMRLTQDFNFQAGGKKNTIQITFDVINVGNLVNKDWGHQYSVANSATELLSVVGTNAPNVQPTFTFPSAFATNNRSYDIAPFNSRWQGQLGVRYIFN
ncbi:MULTISPECIES: carboxypeptidase regulatory-like domain-containing protein [Hymenobacter]|nr:MULTISPECIES: carboxypeptidase regulatory-like domain-containing protein [Hymenobacter]UOQ82977.1 carboxypeptidase regulatory-like domain-containing protein [Hymenobacter sp. 5414T-23]